MKIFLTGATGFVGQALVKRLLADGHTLSAWVRSKPGATEKLGPRVELVDAKAGAAAMQPAVAAADAIVNLAGEPVVGKRWTPARKQSIRASRVDTTRMLAAAIAAAPVRPRVLVSTSAVGYHGDTGAAWVDEHSPRGKGFLADVCVAWEAAAREAESEHTRVCRVRIGLVLGREGGILGTTLPLFKLGLGGKIGDGHQFFPWVHLDDLLGILTTAIADDKFTGPVAAVAPGIVTNYEFTKMLGRVLHRPTIVPVPALALKLALGEAASAMLEGQRVAPKQTEALGYRFKFPELAPALADLVG